MSKTRDAFAGEPFPLPAASPAAPAPGAAWVVLTAPYRGVESGRCVRVSAAEAEALTAEGAARAARPIDISIGASLARDLT